MIILLGHFSPLSVLEMVNPFSKAMHFFYYQDSTDSDQFQRKYYYSFFTRFYFDFFTSVCIKREWKKCCLTILVLKKGFVRRKICLSLGKTWKGFLLRSNIRIDFKTWIEMSKDIKKNSDFFFYIMLAANIGV